MRIAQVSPLYESVPPGMYGGTERVVSALTEELVAMGYEVTLFASGDSRTSARLIPICERSLRLNRVRDRNAPHVLMIERVFQRAEQFDIIHFHTEHLHFPLARRCGTQTITTLHGRLDLPELVPIYSEFIEMPLVSISHHQRLPLSFASWAATVHHGLPPSQFPFNPSPTPPGHLAFVGRTSPEKGLSAAIRIAEEAGMELHIGAKVDDQDRDYFDRELRPRLGAPGLRFLGEVDERQKMELMGNAAALLFPIDWPEPFGLVMIEAMACGTPVIGMRRGSVPEVIDHGLTGFIVDTIDEAVAAVRAAHRLDRYAIRRRFEERFGSRRMTEDYLRVYSGLLRGGGRIGGREAGTEHGRSRLHR